MSILRPSLALVLLCGLGAVRAEAAGTITVATAPLGKVVSDQILGANMAQWFDPTQAGVATSLLKTRFTATRWPGGSQSDTSHWATDTLCGGGGWIDPNASFDNFVQSVVLPAKLDLAITLNYGSNAACTGGGDPAEAAAWVAYAKSKGYKVSHWTVGNEVYGDWEYDLHPVAHDPTTYAAAVATGFYPQVKAADPTAQVGVVVEPTVAGWDQIVLAKAKYDFVEYHWYAQAPGSESDSYLLEQAPPLLAQSLAAVRADLVAAGHAETPIYVGELGSVYANPGKQSTSITQALFAGEVLIDLLEAGVPRATWWLGYGGCSDATSGNFSSSLYGWQNFGGYMLFSDGTPESGCPNATAVPLGTPLPTVRAFQLMSLVAHGGEHILGLTHTGATSGLRAIATTHGTGYALLLINLNKATTMPLTVAIQGLAKASSISINTYGKAQYDNSKRNVWSGPAGQVLTQQALPFALTLPAWSLTSIDVYP